MENDKTGLLLSQQDIELHREWFKEMAKMIGHLVFHRAPRDSKTYTINGELDTYYFEPVPVWVIYEEYPTQQSAKKLGWNSELQENSIMMVCPYDLEGLQVGSLFTIPSAYDHAKGRVFRVLKMKVTHVYPASITCELGPVLISEVKNTEVKNFETTDLNVLNSEEEE